MNKYRPQRNYGCRIHDQYSYFGMRAIVLENDLVRISLLLDKGTEIYEFVYKPLDLDLMWLTANGVQNPNEYLSTSADPIAAFIDYYPGGWQEVFPNGGPTSAYLGAQFGQHGEVAHMPWDYEIVEDSEQRISVRFIVRTKKVPFRLSKVLSLSKGSATLSIEEELTNLSGEPLHYMWGQHLVFGKPFLDEQCRIEMPDRVEILTEAPDAAAVPGGRVERASAKYAWPYATGISSGDNVDLSALPPVGTPTDIVYLTNFPPCAWYRVSNPTLGAAVKVEWDADKLPYLWYWQEFGATKGYPWYGRHYNIGLEPFSSYPTHGLEAAIRNGSAAAIGPFETQSFRMAVTPGKSE
ncbi:DUF4432 family protein [Cohnella yongneupensis]|uniref:DUF4432 family protein n=1 Tax=Cohnella yongneupensis TaxID=425006 RepID=A0ABW0R1W8_9BACL